MVVMSGDTAYTPYGEDGEELSGKAAAEAMEAGYVKTLDRIHRAGLQTTVIRDTPASAQRRAQLRLRRPPEPRQAAPSNGSATGTSEFDVRAAERPLTPT